MKFILFILFFCISSFASLKDIYSFEADFEQNITDEKNKTLVYKGHIIASKPQNALWTYKEPVKKTIYINNLSATIIEPELEQVIIREISSNFDIFKMIKNAKKITKNEYETTYKNTKFNITIQNNFIKSISYNDNFDNHIKIIFTNQKQNHTINKGIFYPKIPLDFDIIRD